MAIEVDDRIRDVLRSAPHVPHDGLSSAIIYDRIGSAHLHLNPDNPFFSLVSHLAHMVRRGELTSSGAKGNKRFKLVSQADSKPPSRYERLMGDDDLDLSGV